MSEQRPKLGVLWMYPDILNLHGDRGNLMALRRIGERCGAEIELRRHQRIGQPPALAGVQLLFFGSGQVRNMPQLAADLAANADALHDYAAGGGSILAIGTAGSLLARHTERADGSYYAGLGLLHSVCHERAQVLGDDIRFEVEAGGERQTLIGCQIQVLDTRLEPEQPPFGRLSYGYGNHGGADEGARQDNVIATNCLGPLLVKNPWFTVTLLRQMAACGGMELPAAAGDWPLERASFALIDEFINKKQR
ncbi:MAG: hypothetical protein Q4B96_03570 [Bacillota bacterium]|nr:hypothetical protein [Bacillota bacterium]